MGGKNTFRKYFLSKLLNTHCYWFTFVGKHTHFKKITPFTVLGDILKLKKNGGLFKCAYLILSQISCVTILELCMFGTFGREF